MRERRLEDYYVGQGVWDFQLGWGKVKEITNKTKPIRCIFNEKDIVEYLTNGKAYAADTNPSLFFEEVLILESANSPDKVHEYGVGYYTISKKSGFLDIQMLNYYEDSIDKANIEQRNFFKTEKEAQVKLDKILEVLKGE